MNQMRPGSLSSTFICSGVLMFPPGVHYENIVDCEANNLIYTFFPNCVGMFDKAW